MKLNKLVLLTAVLGAVSMTGCSSLKPTEEQSAQLSALSNFHKAESKVSRKEIQLDMSIKARDNAIQNVEVSTTQLNEAKSELEAARDHLVEVIPAG